jgi:hypothetical protein
MTGSYIGQPLVVNDWYVFVGDALFGGTTNSGNCSAISVEAFVEYSNMTRTTSVRCKATGSGGACYHRVSYVPVSECCFAECFAAGSGQAIWIFTSAGEGPRLVSGVSIRACGWDRFVIGSTGGVFYENGNDAVCGHLNFSNNEVRGHGSALLIQMQGLIEVRFFIIRECTGDSLPCSSNTNMASIFARGLYGNPLPSTGAQSGPSNQGIPTWRTSRRARLRRRIRSCWRHFLTPEAGVSAQRIGPGLWLSVATVTTPRLPRLEEMEEIPQARKARESQAVPGAVCRHRNAR